jgi:hypothetical protein
MTRSGTPRLRFTVRRAMALVAILGIAMAGAVMGNRSNEFRATSGKGVPMKLVSDQTPIVPLTPIVCPVAPEPII